MSSIDTEALAIRLTERLAVLTAGIDRVEAERRAPLNADFSEQARELAGQDALGGIEEARIHEADAIRTTLARIASGHYGVCSVCGCDIPAARLAALPTATTCVAHAG